MVRPLMCFMVALGALAACSDDPDPNAPKTQPVLDVSKGECLFVEAGLTAEVSSLPVIDCDKPHTHEIFGEAVNPSDVYPGLNELETFAERECFARFEDFVGIGPFDSSLFITWIVPSLDGWNDEDDRTVLCVLGRKDSGQMKTSAQGTKI